MAIIYIDGESIIDIFNTKELLDISGYKGKVKVILTDSLKKDIETNMHSVANRLYESTAIDELCGMELIKPLIINNTLGK